MSTRIIAALYDLPLRAFVDEELFAREMARFFRSEWCFALHRARVARPGQQVSLRVGGREVLLVVDGDGQMRAFSNRCLHDGRPVLETGRSTSAALIRCPHHGWCYRLDGRLLRGPGFDVSARTRVGSLQSVVVSIQGPCVMVAPEAGFAASGPRRAGCPDRPVLVGSASSDLDANWKLVLLGLCEMGWRYVFPNLAVAGDGAMSLLRLEPLTPGTTHVAIDRVSYETAAAHPHETALSDLCSITSRLRDRRWGTGWPEEPIDDALGVVLLGSLPGN